MNVTSERHGDLISVVIPHLNQPDALRRCLASLASQTGARPRIEIIVVDNGSKSLPREICDQHGCTLVQEMEPGPGPARNAGVRLARGATLAFIDADCLAHEAWVSSIARAFSSSDAMILGGDVRINFANADFPTLLEAYESVFAYRMREYIAKKGFTGTGNLAMRANVFDEVGPFKGIGVAEDVDWGQRAIKQGYRITYCDDMIVYHPARKTFAELAKKWDRHIAHDFATISGRRYWRLRWMALCLAVTLSPPAEIPRILFTDRLHGLRARALAAIGVTWIRLYRGARMLSLVSGADSARHSGSWNRT